MKPSNLIFVESTKRFKLIDLGACADLRSGTNYVPDESILDPIYCPPEEYVLPTDSPSFGRNMLSGLISPMLWAQHMPDRFDIFSTGVSPMSKVSYPTYICSLNVLESPTYKPCGGRLKCRSIYLLEKGGEGEFWLITLPASSWL